jgi:FKBP-type peptidyl-prolyl cis-trans isomerase FklB
MKYPTSRFVLRASGLCAWLATAPLAWGQTTPQTAPPAPVPAPAAGETEQPSKDQISYLFGLTFGEQLHTVGISNQVDTDAIARGIKDGLQGKKSAREDQQKIQGFVHLVMAQALAANKQAAKDFLEHNSHEKGVKVTADGLQYKVLIPGDAKAAAIQSTDEVTVQYRGKLVDGSEFDSSYSRGVPATFKVGGVIKGWQEALVLMKPGSKWQLFVPPELAYDNNPRPGIPAGSLLIFEVELVSVKPSATPPAASQSPAMPQSHKAVPPLKPAPAAALDQ